MTSETEAKFLSILQQHKGIIYKVCNAYCKNPEDRKDVAQEIIIHLWKSFSKYNDQYKITTWMYTIALNVAISFYRTTRRHDTFSIGENIIEIMDDNSQSIEAEANTRLLYKFISELDQLNKAVMILYLDNNSYKEIGEIVGITETNVATKISRIKIKLRQQFSTV